MPRIPPPILDSVCYLYHSIEDAKNGSNFGGTAFLLAIAGVDPNRNFCYAVTNWHVACRDGASVLRLNTRGGEPDIVSYSPEDWEFDPRYDIAVRTIDLDDAKHKFAMIDEKMCILQDGIVAEQLGPGEDLFMVGRFIDHDGGSVNRPAVRFGNISVMPSPMEQPNGKIANAYCVDLHSRSGYSGSPVFAYRTIGYDLGRPGGIGAVGKNFLGLLGIHFAQFPEEWELREGTVTSKSTASGVPLIAEGAQIRGLSGMTCVLPAWLILEVLNLPKLKAMRDADNATAAAEMNRAKK